MYRFFLSLCKKRQVVENSEISDDLTISELALLVCPGRFSSIEKFKETIESLSMGKRRLVLDFLLKNHRSCLPSETELFKYFRKYQQINLWKILPNLAEPLAVALFNSFSVDEIEQLEKNGVNRFNYFQEPELIESIQKVHPASPKLLSRALRMQIILSKISAVMKIIELGGIPSYQSLLSTLTCHDPLAFFYLAIKVDPSELLKFVKKEEAMLELPLFILEELEYFRECWYTFHPKLVRDGIKFLEFSRENSNVQKCIICWEESNHPHYVCGDTEENSKDTFQKHPTCFFCHHQLGVKVCSVCRQIQHLA